MEENKPKGNNFAASKSRDASTCGGNVLVKMKMAWRCVLRFLVKYWSWFKEHKYSVISGFIVTILGVWAAFGLAGWGEQNALDRATKQRVHLVVLEAQYNLTDANEIRVSYKDANSLRISVNWLNSRAAVVAIEDTNILSLLPLHKVSLLRAYVNSISTLNQALHVHLGVLETQSYRRTPQEKEARQNVHENACAVMANIQVLQEELKGNFDERLYDQKEAKRIEDHIKHIKRKALKGEVVLSKEG